MNRKIALILALIILVGALAGCGKREAVIYASDTLRVEREGRELLVYDLTGETTYTLTTKRVRKSKTPAEPTTLVNTETITITAIPGYTTIKTAAETVTIKTKRGGAL